MGSTNVRLAGFVGSFLGGRQCSLAADWNLEPQAVLDTGFADEAVVKLLPPEQPTCRSSLGTTSTIDYFAVSDGLAALHPVVTTLEGWDFRPHRLVRLELWMPKGDIKMLRWVAPSGLPKQRRLTHVTR